MNQHTGMTTLANRTIIILFILIVAPVAFALEGPINRVEWQLTDAKVTSWGKLGKSSEGAMRSGIKIEGKAASQNPADAFSNGVFTIVMTAFTPAEDMPGQKKGNWYISGNLIITATATDPLLTRKKPVTLSGVLKASLPYDLTVETGPMEAELRFQHRGVSVRGGRMAKGAFSGKSNLEGKLTTFIPVPLLKGAPAN